MDTKIEVMSPTASLGQEGTKRLLVAAASLEQKLEKQEGQNPPTTPSAKDLEEV